MGNFQRFLQYTVMYIVPTIKSQIRIVGKQYINKK